MAKKEEFSEETIEYLSKLALLDLNEEEKEKFSKQLGDILEHFKRLNDLNTEEIKPTTHAIESLKNVFREDIEKECLSNEEALKNAEHTKDGYFKAPRILKE
ncbi:MAG: Asp-tRNA(Asn)/Glu-tRNA(Gln) amidotransferase subunit GatC [Promethearchaeota archaeon]|nr:MAG: Asp-tRNA(Asn)/Glu-tRNA(Gln) amidotransferase subunit GatC [Candidatus Lokiarchaeota archaeon]